MRNNKLFLIIFIINLVVGAPLANSNDSINNSLEVNEQNQTINFNIDNLEGNLTSDNSTIKMDIKNETEQEEFKNNETVNETIEASELPKLQRPNEGIYLTSPITNYKYEIKKIGNREYQYIREGKTFNSLEEIKAEELQNGNENFYKIMKDLQNKIKQNKSDEKVRVLINLKQDTTKIRQNIEEINKKYEMEERTVKSKIYEISSKYSPKSKSEIAESKIALTKDDIDMISEEGKKLEEVKYKKIRELNSKLIEEGNEVKNNFINWIENNGGELKSSTNVLSFISAEVQLSMVNDIASRPDVISIELDDNKIEPKLDVSVPTISANTWWNAGYRGGWVDVAVVDTGIDSTHPGLTVDTEGSSRVFIAQDFTSSGTTDDADGHGTHVAGIIASSDSTYKGVSSGVDKLINAKHLGGVSSDTLAALDWAITNPSDGAEILSNSWGLSVNSCNYIGFTYADGDTLSWTLYIDAAVDYYDIISVNSAGNEGLCGTYSLTSPADSYNAIVVGAIDDQGTTSRADDTIASYSSVGPTYDERKKPDLVAPGSNIKSANYDWEGLGSNFVEKDGTSMATPHVSGAANLLLEYGLSSKGVKSLMINTAEDKGSADWDAYYGWGELDLNNAYTYRNYVIDGIVSEGSYKLYKVQQILNGEKATLVWNRHVVYAGATTPSTWYDLNDLDLELYKESDDSLQSYSTFIRDNVEQVASSSQFLDGVVKVNAYTTDFNHGLNTEDYSLATQGGYTFANGPTLSINQNVPSSSNDSSNFVITATISNTGDLDGHNMIATLNLPVGLTIISGSNPQTIGSVQDGSFGTATWTVKADLLGTYNNIYSSFTSQSYGELSSGSTSISSIIITDDDLTPPTFNEVNYPLTNKTYNPIKVSSNIIDFSGINSAKLYYDYGNDSIIDGSVVMTLNENLYNAEIPSAGKTYKNQYVKFFIEASDNDNDRLNDSTSGNSTNYYTYIENDSPNITSYAPLNQNPSMDEGDILEFNHTSIDLDGDTLTYSWYLDSILNTTTQNFTYHPNFTDAENHNLTLIVSDGMNSTSTYWNINVNNVNVVPNWNPTPENQVIEEDMVFSYDVNAIDFDNDPITYSINDTEFSINQNGLITWTPTSDWNGVRYITIIASDGILSTSKEISITVSPVNDPPIISKLPNIEFLEESSNNSLDLDDYITDIDTNKQDIVWTSQGNNSIKVDINQNHIVNFSAPVNYFGSELITFIAKDGQNIKNDTINVTVINVNDPIILESIEAQTANEDLQFTKQLTYTDVDGDAGVFYSNDSLTSISQNGLISFTPLQEHVGKRIVKFNVTDGQYWGEKEVLFTIQNVNDAPILNSIDDIIVNESNLVTISLTSIDKDGDLVIYTYASPINSSGHWKTNFSSAGTYIITVTANDGNGGIASKNIKIIVNNDLDQDGLPDYMDGDDDNDGVLDINDNLQGNLTNINTNLDLDLVIGSSNNPLQNISDLQLVEFKENNETLITLNFNFSLDKFYFENVTIKKQPQNNRDAIIIKGLALPNGETKTVYINKLDSTSNSICIKDIEINDISEISSTCDGANEVIINCPGTNGGYSCSLEENKLKVSGLLHSGIKEFLVTTTLPPSGGSGGGSSGGGGGGGGSSSENNIINQNPIIQPVLPIQNIPKEEPKIQEIPKEVKNETEVKEVTQTQPSLIKNILNFITGKSTLTGRIINDPREKISYRIGSIAVLTFLIFIFYKIFLIKP